MSDVIRKLNGYFFDVDENDPIDWGSALTFYGCCALMAVAGPIYFVMALFI